MSCVRFSDADSTHCAWTMDFDNNVCDAWWRMLYTACMINGQPLRITIICNCPSDNVAYHHLFRRQPIICRCVLRLLPVFIVFAELFNFRACPGWLATVQPWLTLMTVSVPRFFFELTQSRAVPEMAPGRDIRAFTATRTAHSVLFHSKGQTNSMFHHAYSQLCTSVRRWVPGWCFCVNLLTG